MILFIQLIVVVLAGASIEIVTDVEKFVMVHKNSWNADSLSTTFTCGQMKQAFPSRRQVLCDNHIIFNFEFIAQVRGGPDKVTFRQGHVTIFGEEV